MKIIKRNFFRRAALYLAALAPILGTLASCGDYSADGETSHSMDIQFAFTADNGATKGASGDNDVADFKVYRLDVFAITASSGIITGKAAVDFPAGVDMRSSATQIVNITVPQGSTEFAVIANASDASDIAKIGQVLTKSQLMAFVADKSTSNTELMMSGMTADPINTTVPNPSVNIALTRTVSRIQIFLNKDASIPEEIKITGVTVKNAASKSNVFLAAASSGPYSDVTVGVSDAVVPIGSVPANGLFITEIPVYENLQGVANQTYLEITGTYAGLPTTYPVYLNNTNTAVTSPLNRNTIYRIYGTIIGMGNMQGIKVGINILPWTERNYSIDVSQTRLEVGKTKLEISSTDVIPVTTNASVVSVRSDAAWLTATATTTAVNVSARTSDYSAPRTANIYITANNVTKVIAVTQRPEQGTISVSAPSFWVSPTSGNDTRNVTVTTTGGGTWSLISPTVTTVTPNITTGSTGAAIKFTRKNHGAITNPVLTDYYGNTVFQVRNDATLETVTFTMMNLYMAFTNISVGNNGTGTNTVTLVAPDVICMGGYISNPGLYNVAAKPTWATTSVGADQSLTINAPGSPDGNSRSGSMIFINNTDPTYIVTATLTQKLEARIPAFDYLVLKVTWDTSGGDVDIKSYFDQSYSQFLNKYLGYDGGVGSGTNARYYMLNSPILFTEFDGPNPAGMFYWGGDAQYGQGESIFFNAPQIDNDNTLPQQVKLYMYTRLFSGTATSATFSVYAYKGGTVSHSDCNFYFTGTEVASPALNASFTKSLSISLTTALKMEVIYDRLLHTATVNYY